MRVPASHDQDPTLTLTSSCFSSLPGCSLRNLQNYFIRRHFRLSYTTQYTVQSINTSRLRGLLPKATSNTLSDDDRLTSESLLWHEYHGAKTIVAQSSPKISRLARGKACRSMSRLTLGNLLFKSHVVARCARIITEYSTLHAWKEAECLAHPLWKKTIPNRFPKITEPFAHPVRKPQTSPIVRGKSSHAPITDR